MLIGTLLIAVPIIIYLINRQRFRRRKWAAMEFLLRAMKKNRRRLQLENLLLLLVRCAIIFLIAVAMARPFVRSRVLGTSSTQPENWIFAIDTSYSMGLRDGTLSLFETARESIGRIVQLLVKPGDRVAVVTLDNRPRVVVPPRQVTESVRGQILQAVADLRPGFESVNVASSLQLVLDVAREFETVGGGEIALSSKKLVVFSDFQRRDWLLEDGPRDPAVNGLLESFEGAGIIVSRADLRGADANLVVSDIGMSPPIASRDTWVEFFATVRNHGRQDFDAVEILFRVDDTDQPPHLVRIAAGETVTRALQYRFTEPGYHVVTVEALVDDLPVDNVRQIAVNVRETADILLVDGEPGAGGVERETILLELALMPEESDDFRRAPYRPVVRIVDQLGTEGPDLGESIAVVLANVAAGDLPESFVDDLKRFVSQGGALLVYLGRNVAPDEYNRVFGAGPDPLLAVPIRDRVNRDTSPVHLRFVDDDHPVASYFQRRREYSYLESPFIEFRRYFRFEDPGPDAGVRPLMRFDDGADSLAAFDHASGEGRIMWFASTADLEWNDFAKYPDFIPFVHETIPYLVRFGESRINLSLGEPFRQVYEAYEYSPRVVVIPPRPREEAAAGLPSAIPKQMQKLADENRFELTHEETVYPGVYEVRLQQPVGSEASDRRSIFAVNLDPAEGDLRRITEAELTRSFPALNAEVFDAADKIREMTRSKNAASGTELWRSVLWGVLLLLVAESLLALFFGRGSR